MIDFVSLEVAGFRPEERVQIPLLSFIDGINTETGELPVDRYGNRKSIAEFGNLVFTVISNANQRIRLFIRGSLHKHRKGNNHEDFTFADLAETIREIQHLTGIHLERFIIHQIEFGVNIRPTMPTRQFIDQIVSHGGKVYELRQYKGKGYLIRFIWSQYELKIYDKGYQYGLPDDILRTEIKVTKMDFLHAKGFRIKTLADLLQMPVFLQLRTVFMATLQKLIFTDDRIDPKLIGIGRDRELFRDASNTRFWKKLREDPNRMRFKRNLDKVDAIRCAFAPDDLKGIYLERLADKWDAMSQNVTFLPLTEQAIALRSYPHIVNNNVTSSKRVCLSCGRDISGQKAGSLFCSEKTFGREAKRCRNMDSNPRNARRRKLQRLYPGYTLFPVYVHW